MILQKETSKESPTLDLPKLRLEIRHKDGWSGASGVMHVNCETFPTWTVFEFQQLMKIVAKFAYENQAIFPVLETWFETAMTSVFSCADVNNQIRKRVHIKLSKFRKIFEETKEKYGG